MTIKTYFGTITATKVTLKMLAHYMDMPRSIMREMIVTR